MDPNTIPVRSRTDGKVNVGWWNIIRTALISVSGALGGGAGSVSETTFTFANGQGAAANVTGLLFDHAVNRCFEARIMAHRKTATNESLSWITLVGMYRDGTGWDVVSYDEKGDASNLTFSITAGGQVQYTSDTMAGTGYTGASLFRAQIVSAT